jgi:hypothetical protein
MKHHKSILAAIFMMAVVFTSCVKPREELIIGKWKLDLQDKEMAKKLSIYNDSTIVKDKATRDNLMKFFETMNTVFMNDNTFKYSAEDSTGVKTKNGKYTFSADRNFIELTSVSAAGKEEISKNEILELTASRYKFVANKDTLVCVKVIE